MEPISKMTKKLKVLCAAAVSISALMVPSISSSESLKEAWAKAYSTNPALAAERARLRSIDEGVAQAKAGWRPTISASASSGAQYIDQDLKSNGSGSDTIMPTAILTEASQPIYRGGRTDADVKRATAEVQAARALLDKKEQEVLLAVGTAYMDVLRDQAVLKLNENNIKVLERQLEATKDRFSVGEVTRTDVAQAEARLARARADRQTAFGNLEVSRASYARQVGEPPFNLTQPGSISGTPQNLQVAVERASKDNPNVRNALSVHESARHSIDLILGELSPTVSLNGEVQQSFETSRSVDSTFSAKAIFKVSVPLYQSGSVSSRVRAAKQSQSQKLLQVEDARRQSIEEATKGWEQLTATRSRIKSLETEIRANEIALEGVQQEALVGTRTVLDILDAEQDLLDSRVNAVKASRDEYVAILTLHKAVGGLTAADLTIDVPTYDPDKNLKAVQNRAFGTNLQD
jgi:outer membrane protein